MQSGAIQVQRPTLVNVDMDLDSKRDDTAINSTSHKDLTQHQIQTIVAFERAGAGISLFGLLWIFVAFATFKRLRTVPNTFIVFASFANLGASIACLIGYNGVEAGNDSALCQAQAFMFELFMQSDPWWSFAMAVNVYLVFFFAANPQTFLIYWWAYFIVCYGFPLVPALCLLLIKNRDMGAVYGNATIWCWIDQQWSSLRIWTYYLPIWVCILLSSLIYISVGYYVFRQRNRLRNLSLSNPNRETPKTQDSSEKRLNANAAVLASISTTVTRTTTIHVDRPSQDPNRRSKSPSSTIQWFESPPASQSTTAGQDLETATYHTITRITAEPALETPRHKRIGGAYKKWCNRFSNMDPVKLAYLRTSFIFAVSVLVTWTPSSINRVHDLVTRSSASYGLNLASGIVLPLQGLWNAVIFFSTSWRLLKAEIRLVVNRVKGLPLGHHDATAVRYQRARDLEMDQRYHHKHKEEASSEATNSTMRVIRDGSLTTL